MTRKNKNLRSPQDAVNNVAHIRQLLQGSAVTRNNLSAIFFKTGIGDYAEHDRFIGVSVPTLRKIAKDFAGLSLTEIKNLIESKFNEERLLALIILGNQFRKANSTQQELIYQFYLQNIKQVNNWNLVDASAHLIIGAHLMNTDKSLLVTLAQSAHLWERRIAIVSTWYFIRHDELEWTFKIATLLLNDTHDLIHKAVGWMLREAGKRDETQLIAFLDLHAARMPRTMLRYAIERLSEPQRKAFLQRTLR